MDGAERVSPPQMLVGVRRAMAQYKVLGYIIKIIGSKINQVHL